MRRIDKNRLAKVAARLLALPIFQIALRILDYISRVDTAAQHFPTLVRILLSPWANLMTFMVAFGLLAYAVRTPKEGSRLIVPAEVEGSESGRIPFRTLIIWGVSAASLALTLSACIWGWNHAHAATASPEPSSEAPGKHQVQIQMSPEGWMADWGGKPPDIAYVVANVGPFLPYKEHFHLLMICRVLDNRVDEMEDGLIEKSTLFSPVQAQLAMEMTMSQSFMMRAATHQPEMVHVALVALPDQVQPEQISKLADVARLGGSILIINGFALQLRKTVTKVRTRRELAH
jgi:hypothetical protein